MPYDDMKLSTSSVNNASALLLCFSVVNEKSLLELERSWMPSISRKLRRMPIKRPVFLVGLQVVHRSPTLVSRSPRSLLPHFIVRS